MTRRPPRRVRTMPTLVARTPRSWASRSCEVVARAADAPASCGASARLRRTSSSVWRTESWRSSTTVSTARWSSGIVIAASARPWPSLIRPSVIACRVSGARSSSRSELLTATRLLPTWRATASWVRPNRSISSRYASAVSIGLRSARWRFSIRASSSESVPVGRARGRRRGSSRGRPCVPHAGVARRR